MDTYPTFFEQGERHLGVLPGGGEQERGQAVRGHVWQPRYSNICDTHIVNVTHDKPGGNEAGEYLTVTSTGDIMIYTDSDTTPGFGFLKITKNA